MGITAHSGPLGSYGQAIGGDSNSQLAPSFWFEGDMILDPRMTYTYQPGQTDNHPYYGWGTAGQVCIIDQVPSAAAVANIAVAAVPVTGTPMTLVSASGAGITVGCSVTNAITGVVATVLGIDVSAARTFNVTFAAGSAAVTFAATVASLGIQVGDQVTLTNSGGALPPPFAAGTIYYVAQINTSSMLTLSAAPGGPPIVATTAGTGTQTVNVTAPNSYYGSIYSAALPCQPPIVCGQPGANASPRLWNPHWAVSRAVVLTFSAAATTATFTVNGYDVYGYPMSQTIAGPASATGVTTTKAFKYITSVVPSGTMTAATVSVGTADVFGLPLRADALAYLQVNFNNALVTPTTFVGADISPAASNTGDVRGTFTGGITSTGTTAGRLIVFWNALQMNIDNSPVGLVGQQQA